MNAALPVLLALLAGAPSAPLKLWHAYRGDEEVALEKSVRLFQEQTGQKVELLAIPYDALASKLSSAIPHGVGPDVFIFAHERLRSFQRLEMVAPAEGFIDRSAYFPNALQAIELDGKIFGYPLSLKCLALYVNNTLVPKPPTNTDEWRAQLKALSKPSENRFGLAYESGDFYFHAPFLFGFGGRLFDDSGKAQLETPALAQSLSFVKQLQDEQLMPQEASSALVKSLFNDGRAAMTVSGPWFAGEISPSISYSVVPLPQVSATGLPMRPFLGVEAAFVSARSDQPQTAQAFAKFLSLGEAAKIRALIGRQVPASVQTHQDPQVSADPLLAAFRDAAAQATPMPNTLEMARVWEPMKLALRAVLQGGAGPQEAGALADRRYRALYRAAPAESSPLPWMGLVALAALGGGAYVFRGPRSRVPLLRRYPDLWRAVAYTAPAAAGIVVLILIPFAVGISLSLFHHDAGHYRFVGLANFIDILASRGYRITEPLSFYFTLAVTLTWTLVNVALHLALGLGLALLLKDPLLKLRGMFRVLLIVPWAVPNYITALTWKGLFHRQFGAINGLLALLHIEPVSWFTHFSTAFAANVATNTWLGFPFMMVVALGALQSIPQDLYEAAEVDGASRWVQFRHITLPLLQPALLPAVILGSIWTFNMFNIIYLVSGGEPGGSTDILVSEAYRWAFQRNEQYGFAAAYSVLIFFVLLAWSGLTRRLTRSAGELMG